MCYFVVRQLRSIMSKFVIYQLLPRYFSNNNPNRVWNGSKDENGCGTLDAIGNAALSSIKSLGVTHIWFTGVIEHATQTDYSHLGIHKDHPAMVKGKAGSPYAIKDYFDIDPDLSDDPKRRNEAFRDLLDRCHQQGLSVIIDLVPNHVAREYHSDQCHSCMRDFGADDLVEHAFNPSNNFYYITDTPLEPQFDRYAGCEIPYSEYPAKATGNDLFTHTPSQHDWYETVKLNYGVNYLVDHQNHFEPTPSTWFKLLDILLYWARLGVDGFRCDMAEMVPVAFWKWVIPRVKKDHPHTLMIAEVYQPDLYREFIHAGFDYLYDKVGMYEALRRVTEGKSPASEITACWQTLNDILPHMIYFMENHDEQRIASAFFAGNGQKGFPGMMVAAALQSNPVLVYAGQELGETGMYNEGFSGMDGRSTIFDYWSLETLAAWNNNGAWNEEALTPEQKHLRQQYATLLNAVLKEKALAHGVFFDLNYANIDNHAFNSSTQFAWMRKNNKTCVLAVTNFAHHPTETKLHIPQHAFACLEIPADKEYDMTNLLTGEQTTVTLSPNHHVHIQLPAQSGILWKFLVKDAD